MFERFTVAARDVVKGAVEVAGEVRAPQVDTGHLLVALARDTGPTGGALTLNADGSLQYTPNKKFVGTDTFTYTVSDGISSSAPATVTIRVTR